VTPRGCRYHNLTGSRLMANRSPSKSCRLSAMTRQPVLCMCQTSLSMPALCAWGLWGSKPGSVAVGFRSERGNGRPSSQFDRRAITGVHGIECESGLRHGSYYLPENASEDQLFSSPFTCSVTCSRIRACPFIYDKSGKTFPLPSLARTIAGLSES